MEVVAVVKGVARAQAAIDDLTKHLTEEERKSGVFYCWEYTAHQPFGRNRSEGTVGRLSTRHRQSEDSGLFDHFAAYSEDDLR
jgi:hypothetical protein